MKLTDEQKTLLAWKLGPGDANKFLRGENPIPEKKVRATADSWKIKPISDKCGTLVLHMHITDANMEIIMMGHIPETMEDHWFIWCDDSHIRIHRSWSGECMFEAEYSKNPDGNGYTIGDVKVNLSDEMDYAFSPQASYALFRCLIRAEIASQWNGTHTHSMEDLYWNHFIDELEKD